MKNILCRILGHQYFTIRRITPVIREVGCKKCKKEWGMHEELKAFLPLDEDLKHANDILKSVTKIK